MQSTSPGEFASALYYSLTVPPPPQSYFSSLPSLFFHNDQTPQAIMKSKAKVEEPTWDRSYRDQTPSDADLSDYDPGFMATANLDISNRFDPTEFTRTPFTIAQGRAKAKAKIKPPTPLISPPNSTVNAKKEEKKGKSKSKKSIAELKKLQDIEDDNIKKIAQDTKKDAQEPDQDTKKDTQEPTKKKKVKKIKFGGYASYAEWDAAEERADRAGGPPIVPAAIQLPPAPKDEKKRYPNQRYPAAGWLDSKGNSKPTTKSFPKTGFTTASALAAGNNQGKKRKAPAPPPPSILQALDAVEAKKQKFTKPVEKKEPVKRGKAAAKSTKGKGKGKKDVEGVDMVLKFGRLRKCSL